MAEEWYEVRVLWSLNPHHVWVLPVRPGSPADIRVEHVGVYGCVPLMLDTASFERCVWRATSEWAAGGTDFLGSFLRDAPVVRFSPRLICTSGSIFDDNIYKFGEISSTDSHGNIKHFSTYLCDKQIALLDEHKFTNYVNTGAIPQPLNTVATIQVLENILRAKVYIPQNLLKKIVHKQTKIFQARRQFEQKVYLEYAPKTADKMRKEREQVFELCKGADYPYLGVDRPERKEDFARKALLKVERLKALARIPVASRGEQKTEDKPDSDAIRPDVKRGRDYIPKTSAVGKTKKIEYQLDPWTKRDVEMGTISIEDAKLLQKVSSKEEEINQVKGSSLKVHRNQLTDTDTQSEDDCTKDISRKKTKVYHHRKQASISKLQDETSSHTVRSAQDYKGNNNEMSNRNRPREFRLEDIDFDNDRYHEPDSRMLNLDAGEDSYLDKSVESKASSGQDMNCLTSGYGQKVKEPSVFQADKFRKLSTLEKLKMLQKMPKLNVTSSSSVTSEQDTSATFDDLKRVIRRQKIEQEFLKAKEKRRRPEQGDRRTSDTPSEETGLCTPLQTLNDRRPQLVDLDKPIPETELNELQKPKLSKEELMTDLTKENVDKIRHLDPSCRFIEGVVTPNLMVHSKNNFPVEPITTLEDIPFSQEIHRKLIELGIRQPRSLQTVSWPAILRGMSLFMVNPRRNGRTMGYVPAVCRHVLDENGNNSGPYAIIICDTTRAVIQVAKRCNHFLNRKRVVLTFYAGIDVKDFAQSLMNHCDVLVATPHFLCQLFNLGALSLDLKYLSMVVLDGCEKIEELYYNEFKFFYKIVNKMLKIRVNPYHQIQYVVVGSTWCDLMRQLALKLSNAVISIGSFHECAVYANTKVTVVVNDAKRDELKKFFSNIDPSKRAVIACNTDEEIKEVSEILKSEHFLVISGGKSLSIEECYRINEQWKDLSGPGLAPVLVCVDENLRLLNMTNAHYLLHYSLPDTYSAFCKRFAVCIDAYESMFEDVKSDVKIQVLVDSENTEQLPKVIRYMKRCKADIPDVLTAMAEKTLIKKDFIKGQNHCELCDDLLAYGECLDYWHCEKRHTLFAACDSPSDWMPNAGVITFNIINYHTPIHYSAVITSYYRDGVLEKIPSNREMLSFKLINHYSKPDNVIPHGEPEVGDVCAVSQHKDFFERCKVKKILDFDNKKRATFVRVKLIDEGIDHDTAITNLYNLPEHLRAIQSHVVQIRLGGVRPKYKDNTFSDLAKDSLELKLKENKSVYMCAKIAFVAGDTIIVDNLEAYHNMVLTKDALKICNIKDFLCTDHAVANENYIEKLAKLFRAAGLAIPTVDKKVKAQKTQIERATPQWAHLESDSEPLVFFSSAEDPGTFFVCLMRFQECLDNLTKDIQNYMKTATEEIEINKGDFVLAKFPDDSLYYRARIDSLPTEMSSGKVQCFFVDHGDWRHVSVEDIKFLPNHLIKILPFQAIECRLVGIKPVGNEWSEWSTNYLYQLCWQADDFKQVYVKYCTREEAVKTGGFKYGIIMIDRQADERSIINDMMLNANMADVKEDEQQYLEHVMPDSEKRKQERDVCDDDSDNSIVDEEWRKEAEPYRDVVYERQAEHLPIDQFDLNEDDFEMVNDDIFIDMLKTKKETNPLPQLPCPATSSPLSTAAPSNPSACSSYEIISRASAESNSEYISLPENTEIREFKEIKPVRNEHILDTSSESNLNDSQNESSKFTSDSDLPPQTGRKPKLTWHQTKTNLIIKIELADVQDYKLDIKPRSLTFETYVHDTDYYFNIEFYGAVNPDKCSHTPKGLYLLVKMTKLVKINWKSLTSDEVKRRWIAYDQDALWVEESDEEDNLEEMKNEFRKYIEEKREMDLEDEEDSDDEWDPRY